MWIKIAVQEIGPITLVAFRVLFGLLFGVVVIYIQRIPWPRTLKEWTPLLVLSIANIAIPFFLISWGEQSIDSAVASILNATTPLFTILIAHFLLQDDKMTFQKVLGLLIGFAGVVILLSKDLTAGAQNSVIGQAAVILASLFYAGSAVYGRKLTQHIQGSVRGAMLLITSTIFMWIVGPLTERPFDFPDVPITWIAILFLGILGSGLAVIMLWYLIHEVGPTRA